MSLERANRALALMAQDARAILAPARGGYGVFTSGDRRTRPRVMLSQDDVRALAADGAVRSGAAHDQFVLSPAGAARVRRTQAPSEDAFLAQHAEIAARPLAEDGAIRMARGFVSGGATLRLARLKDPNGAPWFTSREIAAAQRLRADWELGQAGLARGSDWTAPPRGGGARGPGNAVEAAMAAGVDARARVDGQLNGLAPMLRRVVERVCLGDVGLDALERAEGWPARSAKVALKLALAQLAEG